MTTRLKKILELFWSSFFAFFASFLRFSRYLFLPLAATLAQAQHGNIGRPATAAEVRAWDIDVRPDFKGLPKGFGSVSQGEKIWEAQCASCHGSFGESNEVFPPLIGYTSAKDSKMGRVAALDLAADAPTRTTMMKVSQLSTLWDYINRAMPWTAPKSLKPDEVYALTAYMLHLANVVPSDFTLSDKNIAQTQKLLPNRNGKTTAHALWPGLEFKGHAKPDVQGSNCMKNCVVDTKLGSFIPDYAKDAHGNLAEQMRPYGATKGVYSLKTAQNASISMPNEVKSPVETAGAAPKNIVIKTSLTTQEIMPTLQKYACTACHGIDQKLVGPSFKEVLSKQGARSDAVVYLSGKIKAGGQGVYGQIPMPAQILSDEESNKIAQWLLNGMSK